MGTYGDTGDYPDAGTLTGAETLLIDDGADTLSTTVQTIANLATNASNLTSGTVADARIASTIARDSEVTSAISTHSGDTDPHGDRAYALGLVDDLSGVSNAATARSNLGLGGAATLSVGTTTGTVAAGDDSRITSAASLGLAYAISQSVFTP